MTIRSDRTTSEAGRYTIGSLLAERAEEIPEKNILVFPDTNENLTYHQFHETMDQVSRSVIALTSGKRVHCAIWAPNIREWLSIQFGCAQAGYPVVSVNTNVKAQELSYILNHSDTIVLFVAGPQEFRDAPVQILRELYPASHPDGPFRGSEEIPSLTHVIYLGTEPIDGTISYGDFLRMGESVSETVLKNHCISVRPDDIFSIQYTSGTTGKPKGVMTSHAAYCINGFAVAHRQNITADDISCIPSPFFHAYGCISVMAAICAGAAIAPVERYSPSQFLKTIETCRATMICGTPTMFFAALEELTHNTYDISSLRGGNMAGAPCPPDLVKHVCEKMDVPEFGVLYGATEIIVPIMNGATDSLIHRTETMGYALPDVILRVVDPILKHECASGEPGELLVRCPSVMKEYYKMPEMTREAIDSDGFYHTGDMVTIDQDGYVSIAGRIKDMIIRGGENLYPAEIESAILTHPDVLEVQVVGIPSDYYGEEVVAFVRLHPGSTIRPVELKRYAREIMAIDKVPALFYVVESFPLTASGKVQKFKLREYALLKMKET